MIEWKMNFTINAIHDQKQAVNASVTKSSNGFEAYNYRRIFSELDDLEEYIEVIEETLGLEELSNYRIYHEDNPKEKLEERFDAKINNAYELVNDEIYINPLLFLTETMPRFLEEDRKFPIEFDYAKTVRIQTTFQIPEGYAVEFLPKELAIPILRGKADYRIRYKAHKDHIEIQSFLSLRQEVFMPDDYTALRNLFEEIHATQSNPIILKKISE